MRPIAVPPTMQEALTWSGGRALYAVGVQFPPVRLGGSMSVTGRATTSTIFPGAIGLVVFATRVPDELFISAATAAADQVTQAELDSGLLYPPQNNILQTEIATAVKVCEVIFDHGLAGVQRTGRHPRLRPGPAVQPVPRYGLTMTRRGAFRTAGCGDLTLR